MASEIEPLAAPLRFALNGGEAGIAKLRGLEALVAGRVAAARAAGEDAGWLTRIEAAVRGFEAASPAQRLRQVQRLAAVLAEGGVPVAGAVDVAAGGQPSEPGGAAVARPASGRGARPRLGRAEAAAGSAERPASTGPRMEAGPADRAPTGRGPGQVPPPGGERGHPVLDGPLSQLPGVGPKRAAQLAARGIRTVRELLFFLPTSWSTRTGAGAIAELRPGETAVVEATVVEAGAAWTRGRRRIFEAVVEDETGRLRLRWFHRAGWLERRVRPGQTLCLAGTVRRFRGRLEMVHPEILEAGAGPAPAAGTRQLQPRYGEVPGVPPRALARLVAAALEHADALEEVLPRALLQRRQLLSPGAALRMLHAPPPELPARDLETRRTPAHRRLAYEEFFFLQLGLALKARGVALEPGIAFPITPAAVEEALGALPFAPTEAQARVVREIAGDMARPQPMHRLLQGDVGSGKTAVAAVALRLAADAGYQAAVMAPTELLAEQHARTLEGLLEPAGIEVTLVRGRQRPAARREAADLVARGEAAVVVGTHALLEEAVRFRRLGLVVVDEQHRFGVRQRAALLAKGHRPDLLVMTATPIPRTLAMTAYGDLEVSLLDALPPGRQPVETRVLAPEAIEVAWQAIREAVASGRQAYVVYPLVDASERLEAVAAATEAHRHLDQAVFPDLEVGLLHGRLPAEEKARVMEAFAAARVQVLVATTVVEVGIDVPNATVMVVQHAERFGLAQLHQLRGRVGRGRAPGRCFLVGEAGGGRVAARLAVMEQSSDGFEIAEADLRIRGPGELLGTRQSGLPDLAFGHLVFDRDLLLLARRDARALLERDPELSRPEHRATAEELRRRWQDRLRLGRVG